MSNSEKIPFIPVAGITKDNCDDIMQMSREGIIVLRTTDCITREPTTIMLSSSFADLRNFMEAIGQLNDQVRDVIKSEMPEGVVKH